MNGPIILAAIIQGFCAVIATVIAAFTAAMIGKKFSKQESMKANLEAALSDIEFLLAVEEEHCNLHKKNSNTSNKIIVRDTVRDNSNLEWSGKFTPGRVNNP